MTGRRQTIAAPTRRAACAMIVCGGAGLSLVPRRSFAAVRGPKALSFHQLHTGERLRATFWRNGHYDRGALSDINHVLRDHYSGEVTHIDRRLLDLLFDLNRLLDTSNPFEVISAYRSPKTNERLRKQGHAVAKHSLHMKGMAIDIRVRGRKLASLHHAAREMARGGVGYYPKSNFVHVDVGRVRCW